MKTFHYLYIALVALFLAIVAANLPDYLEKTEVQGRKIQRVFIKKLDKINSVLNEIDFISPENTGNVELDGGASGISFAVFKEGQLVFWSDKEVSYSKIDFDSVKNGSVQKIVNSTYYVVTKKDSLFTKVGLVRLANDYPYENKFLNNGLLPEFSRYGATVVPDRDDKEAFVVVNEQGGYAFSIKSGLSMRRPENQLGIFATLFLIIGLVYILVFIRYLLLATFKTKLAVALPIALGVVLLIRVVLVVSGILTYKFHFFKPFLYATPIAPSFGDLILNSIVFVFFSYLVYRFVSIPKKYLTYKFNRNAWIGILNVLLVLVLCFVQNVSHSLITDSSLSIVIHNISQVNFASVISYVILAVHYLGFFLLVLWVIRTLEGVQDYKLLLNFATVLIVVYAFSFALRLSIDLYTVLFAIAMYYLVLVMKEKLYGRTIFSSLVVLLFVFAIYIVAFTVHFSRQKEGIADRSIAENLANEHDPVAEYMFKDLEEGVKADSLLRDLLFREDFDVNRVATYLSKNYFKDYLKKYDSRIAVCGRPDSVLFNMPHNRWCHCYTYYNDIIGDLGVKVPGVPFYYLENLSGSISYLGWLKFEDTISGEVSLFIELDSKLGLTTQPLGYPELLLDRKARRKNLSERYSYAKYYKGNLVSQEGDFGYSLKSDAFKLNSGEVYYNIKQGSYDHLIYRPNQDNFIVVTKLAERAIDLIVIFSYVFVFYYILVLVGIFFLASKYRHLGIRDSLRSRIQYSIILILMTSLILIAGGTTWFNIRKYNQSQFRIIQEKIQSVYVELEHKLSNEDRLTNGWSAGKYESLDQLLIKFSDVFYSDINLYSPEGNLLATSRSEIFQLGLQSLKMDPVAYYQMNNNKLAKFVHEAQISRLHYLSAYVPFMNNQGKLLAYLNLPYFTKQQELQTEITTLTVAIVNVYVLLILLTIIIAVFISNQITKPLEMIQARFRDLTIGARYDEINYQRQDELGQLVNEYNRMVRELERSVDLLAKSERESAWREMAKQVAHEIKNPLTPMRLSVQQLQRAWDDKKDNFETYLRRVTQTLIEQIDNLSTIASEFSNFAKMPVAQMEEVDLAMVLQKTVALFRGNEKVTMNLQVLNDDVIVRADKEQLSRVFINIVKNGIQAIPDNKPGKIKIELFRDGNNARINISDNGKGIPHDVREKLFMPSFTTKTSGMGIGLTIVLNAIEQVGGSIEFDTEIGVGTTFKIRLPLFVE